MILTIKGALTDLNTYINAERSNRFMGAKIKKQNTQIVYIEALRQHIHKIKPPVYISFRWYCKNKKKDKDNVAYAKKHIFDGLILAKVIPSDGWDNIEGWITDNEYDKFYQSFREQIADIDGRLLMVSKVVK